MKRSARAAAHRSARSLMCVTLAFGITERLEPKPLLSSCPAAGASISSARAPARVAQAVSRRLLKMKNKAVCNRVARRLIGMKLACIF